MSRLKLREIDPYKILFPLGFLHAVIGTSYWIAFALGLSAYPGSQHAHEMLTGFLLSFASGFLLTAVPRFTGSARCTIRELVIATLLSVLTFFIHHAWLTFLVFSFLASFFIRRYRRAGFTPPVHFIFLPIGLGLGILSSGVLSLIEGGVVGAQYTLLARLVLHFGTLLAFLLGIGAKLISALLGWAAPPLHQIESAQKKRTALSLLNRNRLIPYLQALLFLLSFLAEILGQPTLGKMLRAVCASWIGVQNWKLLHFPLAEGKLPFWIWISAWLLILGLWVQVISPEFDIHSEHLIFVMGYGLMTFMVASRVTLAHGGYPLECEFKSRVYALFSILIIVAGVTRFAASLAGNYNHHLGYAAATWITGLFVWGKYFLPKILRPYTND